VQLPTTTLCLTHTADKDRDALQTELDRLRDSDTVDARGVVISAELLQGLLDTLPHRDNERVFTVARFERATFQGNALFAWAHFQGVAEFAGVTFQSGARFDRATFQGKAEFAGVTFQGETVFERATFEKEAEFNNATFQGNAKFDWARFQNPALFEGASFQRRAGFDGATFRDRAVFDRASFERATQVGPLGAKQLELGSAVFGANVQFETSAAVVRARGVQFPAGGRLLLRYALVILDDANLAAPTILAGDRSAFPSLVLWEQQIPSGEVALPPGPSPEQWRPRLLSVRRADVAGLRVADIDLGACRFVGAHNLDRLRLEGAPLFTRTTGWWRARRKTLAEEQHWRADRPGRWRPGGWYPQDCQPPEFPEAETPEKLEPARLAALYRDLRKGREDAKDEPGAADFYYGECEMRRHNPDTSRAERLVLWGYWLVSGYALRAWRALAALAMVIVVAGIGLALWGFPSAAPTFRPAAVGPDGALVYREQPPDPPPELADAIRLSARSATALLRGPDRVLTPVGEWLDMGLRFIGPLLLGLAVLSVRGRVRR
jgi:Pentapeptide repeats (9 copies)